MNEAEQKQTIRDFFSSHDLSARDIKEKSTKTPDFIVLKKDDTAFYCELKSLDDPWLDGLLDQAPPGSIVGGGRNDPTFNRICKAIERSAKQFNAVNPLHEEPNVLVLFNLDDNSDIEDLFSILTGNFYADDGSISPIYRQFSEGRVKESKKAIDLYIWVDVFRQIASYKFAFDTNSVFFERLCASLDKQASDITRNMRFY